MTVGARRHVGRALVLIAAVLGLLATTASASIGPPAPPTAPPSTIVLTIFHGEGCPHCHDQLEFLAGLSATYPQLEVRAYEIWYDAANRDLFRQVAAEHGVEPQAVPTTFLDGEVWMGFSAATEQQLEARVRSLARGQEPEPVKRTLIDVPFMGVVDVGDDSLVLATLVIGFVDGVNPCSLWVLSMLLALVLHSGSRRRVMLVGTMFLTITAALYGLYMVGLYSVLDYAGEAVWIRMVVVVVAGGFGLLHLKEFVTDRGLSVTIPDARKPGLFKKMRALASPDRSMPAVLGSTALLAVAVSLLETPCTAGLPLLWTNMLSDRGVEGAGAALLFMLYLSVFLLDELIVFGLAVVTMRATKLQEHHGRALQLVSGTLMLTLAFTMLFAPSLLTSLAGTAAVFGGAALVVGLVLLVDRWRPLRVSPPRRPSATSR